MAGLGGTAIISIRRSGAARPASTNQLNLFSPNKFRYSDKEITSNLFVYQLLLCNSFFFLT